MRIAVRPPEFLPRLEYFALMCRVDVFVLADTFQYSRQSYHNRAKLRTPAGWQWQSIPLEGGQHGRSISETRVSAVPLGWRRRLWRSLEFNYRSSPYFEYYEDDVRRVVESTALLLGQYTAATVDCVHGLLQLSTKLLRTSELAKDARAVTDVLSQFDGSQLVVLEDTAGVDAAAVPEAEVVTFEPPEYRQNFGGFERGMSSLDAVFNLGAEATRQMLRA